MGERQIIQQRNLTFILTDKITVSTGVQKFHLEPVNHHWRTRTRVVRHKIETGEIKTIVDLASECGNKIKWVTTYHDY
jgi:hypothetical protein